MQPNSQIPSGVLVLCLDGGGGLHRMITRGPVVNAVIGWEQLEYSRGGASRPSRQVDLG